MSMNVNVTLPLDVVAAILSLDDEPSGDEAKAAITPAAAQAIVAGVKTLPFLVAANSSAGERKRKREEDSISVWILGCYRDVARISINPSATVYDLKNAIRTGYGIPYVQQDLSFDHKDLNDFKTLQEYNMKTGSAVYLSTRGGMAKLTPTSND